MRIAVIAPSEQYMALAGVRIRYQRITSRLATAGHSLEMVQISDFDRPLEARSHDAYIFSKCYDARSYLLSRTLSAGGALIGVDFFDDYFGQALDSRFVRHREWIRTMAPLCDFYMCSTPRMRDVVSGFMPSLPGHVLNDPFDAFDASRVARLSKEKLQAARAKRHVDVVWFGVGDNPNFPIGLKDLAASGDVLSRLVQRGFEVDLRILTNRRALTVEGLSSIGRLAVPHSVEEWTQEREAELLEKSLLAFIPVNSQLFSIAKSLNRAVTALTGGSQVLSPGYPLYKPLSDFIYTDPDTLIDDIEVNRLKVQARTVKSLSDQLAIWGNPDKEAENLGLFLTSVASQATARERDMPLIGLVHGKRSPADSHKAAQRLGHFSIGSPFSNEKLNYDIGFVYGEDGTQVQLSAAAVSRLPTHLHRHLTKGTTTSGKGIKCLLIADALPGHPFSRFRRPIGFGDSRTAMYADTIRLLTDVVRRLFPDIEIFLSELDSPLTEARPDGNWAAPVTLDGNREVLA